MPVELMPSGTPSSAQGIISLMFDSPDMSSTSPPGIGAEPTILGW